MHGKAKTLSLIATTTCTGNMRSMLYGRRAGVVAAELGVSQKSRWHPYLERPLRSGEAEDIGKCIVQIFLNNDALRAALAAVTAYHRRPAHDALEL
eukprot:366525-Chlamydomonas_euryale.AAC.2